MNTILYDWYYTDKFLSEKIVSTDPGYHDCSRRLGEQRERLVQKLSSEEKKLLEEMETLLWNVSVMECYAHFEEGFRMGALLMQGLCGS